MTNSILETLYFLNSSLEISTTHISIKATVLMNGFQDHHISQFNFFPSFYTATVIGGRFFWNYSTVQWTVELMIWTWPWKIFFMRLVLN